MKYQSEIIKEIVDGRGHKKSSIHYESECIETWIEENKGAYPKLCDYEGEWLYYINESPIGEFPYVTLSDVTEATIENVVPYAYKSAILKGQTLVNLLNKLTVNVEAGQNEPWHSTAYVTGTVKSGKYILLYNVKETSKTTRNTPRIKLVDDTYLYHGYDDFNATTGIKKWIFTANTDLVEFNYWVSDNTGKVVVEDFILLEYQDGMENWDIPYFEGMQSVKMPVLTTIGKNLFDGKLEKGYINASGDYVANENAVSSINYIHVTPNTKYIISSNDYTGKVYIHEYDVNYNHTKQIETKSLTTSKNTHYIKFNTTTNTNLDVTTNFQLEEGNTVTSYEPYKSNILTVNEDVTLRSNGNVYDELDLLTGKLTQRIDENNEVLAQEVVKTVDLSVSNQNGDTCWLKPIEGTMHLETSSDTIQPSFSGEIPVEATTQNLASFIEE